MKLMHLEKVCPTTGVIPAKTIMKKNGRMQEKNYLQTLIGGGEKALLK
ncbi:hypothetical protein [Turicimonas muris]